MRTLLAVPDIFAGEGGIARSMRLYLKALCELAGRDDTVDYVALCDRPGDAARAAPYINERSRLRLGSAKGRLSFVFRVLRHGWGAGRIICGHVHHLPLLWFLQLFRPGLASYLIAHGIEVWRPYSWLEKRAMRGARRILCVSEYTRRQMLRFDPGLDPVKLVVVPNTIDPVFARRPAVPAGAAPQRERGSGPVILVVSRLVKADPYKGVDLMIEAMPHIRRQYPDARLRIVGGGDDVPRLQSLAQQLEVGAAVHLAGPIDDSALRGEYERCDLFALPSRKEGFGLVYLEAMSHGKPCIAARAGGAPEVVTEEVGVVVEYGNIPQIALAVEELIEHPRSAASIAQRAAAFAYPEFVRRLGGLL